MPTIQEQIDAEYEASEQRAQNQYDNEEYVIDVSRDYPEQQFLFRRDAPFSPLGDIQIIKAKQKAGKTRFCLHLMAAAMGGEHIGTRCLIPECRVLYCDTEQHVLSTVNVARGVLKAANMYERKHPERFKVLNLRKCHTEERWARIRQEIHTFKPHFTIIDGVRDIVSSINDEEVATKLNEELMTIAETSNSAIWLLIHVNKNDNNPRGHVGTELQNKGSETWEITKETMNGERIYKLEQVDCRNKEVSPFSFMLDEAGIPVMPYIPDSELEELKDIFREIVPTSTRKADIIKAFMDNTGKKKTAAYDAFNKANGPILAPDPAFSGKYYYVGDNSTPQ